MPLEQEPSIATEFLNWREEFEPTIPELVEQLARLRYEEIGAPIMRGTGESAEPIGHI